MLKSLSVAVALAVVQTLPAQLPADNLGLMITAGGGAAVGSPCGLPDCNVPQTRTLTGQSATVTVFGPPRELYALALSAPDQCSRVPSVGNNLLIALPAVTWAVGILDQPPQPITCFVAHSAKLHPIRIPVGTPLGTYRFQAVVRNRTTRGPNLAFTGAVDLTVL